MPRAPKHCGSNGCRVVVPPGTKHCADHTREAWSGGMNAYQGHGTTREQRKLVAQVLREEPWCQDCGTAPSVEAGHKIPKSHGGAFVRENLKGQCRPCNLAQMQTDRGGSRMPMPRGPFYAGTKRDHPAAEADDFFIGTLRIGY